MKKTVPFTFYLLYYTALSFCAPFVVLYYQELGFNGAQIGLMMGMFPLITLFGAPLWTGLADAKKRHKLIMSLTLLGTIAVVSMFPLVKTLPPIIVLVFLFSLLSSPTTAFADSATMAMLAEEKAMYGRVRLGGTLGWGIFAVLAGIIIQSYGIRWAFWGYALIMLLAFIVSQKFTFGHRLENVALKGDFRQLLSDRRWVYFLSLAFVGGVAFSAMSNFLSPYLEGLGASRSMLGFAQTIAMIGELPVLFFANRLLKRFGAYGLLGLGMTITGVRLLLYAWLNFPAGILFFQLLNGMAFPLVWVAGVSYADENAPEGMKATAQGLLGAMVFGFGAATGGLVGGLMLGSIGGRWMYLIFGSCVLVSVGVITLLERAERSRQARGLI